ncbi:hypothetical protein FPV67DRAFT_880158 [Lyophyllum atratum]|nr:hypothetical protein FPV67DRAFT_880158 [Lyophyllum atratum]
MDQRFMGVDSGLSRRGTRRDPSMPQSHAQSFQPSPPHASSTNFPDYRSSTGPTSYWPAGSANQPPFDSPSPSSSSDGSTNMKYESTTLSLSPREALPHLPIEDYLRQEIPALPRNGPVNLWALPEPSPGARPPLTYKLLASLAIFGSPYKRLSLQEIYENIEQRFAWYRNQSEEEKKKWQGSLRHNLSLECIFRHNGRPVAEPGKGGYWTLTNADGYGQKRPRKRRGKTSKERAKAEDEVDQLLEDDEDVQIQGHPGGRLVRSSPVPQHSAQASPYAPGPQPGSSFGGGPMSSSDSFNPGVVFGQPSFPPPGPMRNFGQDPVPRMQSLPTMGNRPGSRQALTRSATSPLPGMQSYHSMPGTDDGQRRHGYEYGQYQEQGAMDVDEDSRRARGSRRMDKGMRRGYN